MQGRHTGNAADAPCFPVSSSITTCQMHKGRKGGVCLPDMVVVCMLIGVWWRYASDGRVRDERDQGHGSRKLREPGIFGISLVYAADMCQPTPPSAKMRACPALAGKLYGRMWSKRDGRQLLQVFSLSYGQLPSNMLMISYTMTWGQMQEKKGGKFIGVPGSQPYGRLSLGHAVMSLCHCLGFGLLGLVLVSSHLPRAVGSGVCLCVRAHPSAHEPRTKQNEELVVSVSRISVSRTAPGLT